MEKKGRRMSSDYLRVIRTTVPRWVYEELLITAKQERTTVETLAAVILTDRARMLHMVRKMEQRTKKVAEVKKDDAG